MGGGAPSQPAQTTTTQVAELPEFVKPAAAEYLGRAQQLSNAGFLFQPYSGPRIAGLFPDHEAGIAATREQATNGFQGQEQLGDLYESTVRGDFLSPDSNPFLRDTFDAAAQGITDQYRFSTAPQESARQVFNRSMGNSGATQYEDMQRFGLGQNLSNLAAQVYGGNYQAERALQQQALGLAPMIQDLGYRDAQALLGVGDIRRDVQQQAINADLQNYFETIQAPMRAVDVLGTAVATAAGGGGQTALTAPSFFQSNPLAGLVGGGLAGYGVGSQAFPGGFGGLSGGAAGGLAGAGLGYLLS